MTLCLIQVSCRGGAKGAHASLGVVEEPSVELGKILVDAYLFDAKVREGDFTFVDYLVWNEIPTVLGNLVGGFVFVALPLYYTHVKTSPNRAL